MSLAEDSWVEWLTWFPTQVAVGWTPDLDFLIRLTNDLEWVLYLVVDRTMN